MEGSKVIEKTRNWVESFVVGLGLCPFAERVCRNETLKYVLCESSEAADVLKELSQQLLKLSAAPRTEIETMLLVFPNALKEFLDFNDFMEIAESLVSDLKLEGVIQIVGFHPAYQFAETQAEAPENYTNRSPYPTLHLLREASISDLDANPDDLLEIPKRNIQNLRRMGLSEIQKRLSEI